MNGLENVSVVHCALSDAEGTAPFASHDYSSDSRIAREAGPGTTDVACSTLDRVVEERGIDQIDLLKIDTEGGERRILDGGRTKALPRRRAAVVEIHHRDWVEPIDRLLSACGLEKVGARRLVYFYTRRRDP